MSPLPAIKEPATVYRSLSGRRFFTLRGALRSSAWALVKKRCECEDAQIDSVSGGMVYPGFVCRYHRDSDDSTETLGARVAERLTRRWLARIRRERGIQ